MRIHFALTSRLTRAIRQSPLTLTALAFPVGLTQSKLSYLLHDASFGRRVREKVLVLGANLGIPADRCTRCIRGGAR